MRILVLYVVFATSNILTKFNDLRVSTKLWCGVFGLLLLTLAVTAGSQYHGTVSADAAMGQVRAYEHRIATAIEWRGATETVGDRVLASNASADNALSALFDARVKSGSVSAVPSGRTPIRSG